VKTNSGFSLVEVMCAILILGFGLVGLTEGITVALGSNKEAEVQTAAALLAAGQIETLRADNFLVAGESEGEGEGDLSAYSWKQDVTETDIEGLYEVTVVVEKSGQQIYELKTLLFDPPLTQENQPGSRDRENKRRRA
jgi:prepilin-type N-terminal cleavage/methylation domain-containing protein